MYYVDTCQKGEIAEQIWAYFGLLSKFPTVQNFRLFWMAKLTNSFILDKVFYSVNIYVIVFLRRQG